jgi:hypothetical protein
MINIEQNNIPASYKTTINCIRKFEFDFILAVADRPEQVGSVLAAFHNKIPIGHLYAGDHNTISNEITTFDDIHRHVISLYSNIQFCSCADSKNNGNWNGGISFNPYCEKFNDTFKEAVRERDDYICQLCGHEQKLDGCRLSIHHIHYDKENCYPDVIALCRSCNSAVNANRDHWEQYFEDLLIERGLVCWSITRDT